jgi:Ca-activated chloride channel homolog
MNTEYTPNEEELTAYVLGEVDDTKKEWIESAITTQPETKVLLDGIRQTIELSAGMFAHADSETLSSEQREVLTSAVNNVVRFPKRRAWQRVVGYAAAAGIVAAIGAGIVVRVQMTENERSNHGGVMSLARVDQNALDSLRIEDKLTSLTEEQVEEIARPKSNLGSLGRGRTTKEVEYLDDKDSVDRTSEGLGGRVYGDASVKAPAGTMVVGDGSADRLVTMDGISPTASAPTTLFIAESSELAKGDIEQLRSLGYVTEGEVRVEEVQQLRRPIVEKKKATILARTPQQLGKPQTQVYVNNAPATASPQVTGQTTKRLELQHMLGGEQPASSDDGRFKVAGVAPQDNRYFAPPPPRPVTLGTEAYEFIVESRFKKAADAPLSTFSIDVDTASYSNMRRFITQGSMPPVDSVRIEELINYFNYDYPQPVGEDPFSSSIEVASAPWNPAHKLVRVGLKGKDIVAEERPSSNLIFLLDVSGSMSSANKLPLVKQSIRLLTQQLTENDRVAIVVYAGNSGLVLPSTRGDQHAVILDALNRLGAGGSTNGGAGIQLAYDVAAQNFIEGGVNRVIMASDGDFNVGTTSRGSLVELIEQKAKSGVFLSVLGFGMGNLKDATMENLADKGNGNYAYIDTFHEAKKVLVDEMNGTLFTIAKDVKIQVEFNPSRVHAYRLIGYENRALANRDFNDDTKDAGEIGAGHTMTALYEIVPTGVAAQNLSGNVDELRYKTVEGASADRVAAPAPGEASNEMLTLKLRYKQPDGDTSKLLVFHLEDRVAEYAGASADFKFATAVAAYGMKLRNSPFAQSMTYDTVLSLAESGRGHDLNGYRSEFIDLVRRTKSIAPRYVPTDPRRY